MLLEAVTADARARFEWIVTARDRVELDRRLAAADEVAVGTGQRHDAKDENQKEDESDDHDDTVALTYHAVVDEFLHVLVEAKLGREDSHGEHCERHPDEGVRHEQCKEFVILVADASTHPRAVMVHLHHALVAHRAVVRSWRLDLVTFDAILEPH